jgi:hypothetical protein
MSCKDCWKTTHPNANVYKCTKCLTAPNENNKEFSATTNKVSWYSISAHTLANILQFPLFRDVGYTPEGTKRKTHTSATAFKKVNKELSTHKSVGICM